MIPDSSTRDQKVTKPDFRPCSACMPHSQAPLCLCTLRLISNQAEGTFGRLRYLLGGDRPSQTTRLIRSPREAFPPVRGPATSGWYSTVGVAPSHLSSTDLADHQYQGVVKLHGVFPSYRG